MDEKVLAYFSSINPIASKIIKDETFLRNAVGEHWNNLDLKHQEDLIDDFMVDVKIRELYASVQKSDSYPLSFPKLRVETGEKINVEFEDDCWTWQDEHSSPFNWRTKSQQDLTLDDLESEALGKAPVKLKKKESENQPAPEDVKMAPQEFTVQSANSIWDSPFLQGVKKPDFLNNRSRSASPYKSTSVSKESLSHRSKTPEEVNYAFAGSTDDLSSSHSLKEEDRSMSVSSGEALTGSPSHVPDKQKAPKRQRSLSKSPIKSILPSPKKGNSEQSSEALVSKQKEEDHAFDNPALGTEWSSFVNENPSLEPSSAASTPSKRLLKEPEPVTIDRGDQEREDNLKSKLFSEEDGDFHDETLIVETNDDINLNNTEADPMNSSTLSKTGFDFLDNW